MQAILKNLIKAKEYNETEGHIFQKFEPETGPVRYGIKLLEVHGSKILKVREENFRIIVSPGMFFTELSLNLFCLFYRRNHGFDPLGKKKGKQSINSAI